MLSIDDSPSDTSCSNSKASSDPVEASHGEHSQLPSFSLRDYVFKSRSRDIRINWPFREQLLKLCVDNGIRDLLPPFEPPSVVRAGCVKREEVESDQLPILSGNQTTILEHEERGVDALLELSLPLDSSVVENLDKLPVQRREYCEVHQERNQELISNIAAVSDPMASKVCPVCKAFTSTSNTTLNAHIDQCLSCDPCDVIRDASGLAKSTVKPRKKRLMIDIYATARHCTLEDLDRRNGTNWAINVSLLATANHVDVTASASDLGTKRTKFSSSSAEGKAGDIYVDSNGTKILILSKINDSSPSATRNNLKLKKYRKGFKEDKSCLKAKKRSLKLSCSRFVSDIRQTRLDEIDAEAEGNDIAEAQEGNEESLSTPLDACYRVKNKKAATLGHWVCSKRSDMSRKLCGKNISNGSEKNIFASRKLLSERSGALNLASSAEAAVSPNVKGVNILCKSQKGSDNVKKSSTPPSKVKSNDIYMADMTSTHESHNLLLKPRKSLASLPRRACFAADGSEVNKRENFAAPKKIRRHRSISGRSKLREREKYSVTRACHATNDNHQSRFSENHERGSLGKTSAATVVPVLHTNLSSIPEELNKSTSRDAIHVVSLVQRSTGNQEVKCSGEISDGVISSDVLGDQSEQTLLNGKLQTDTCSLHGPKSACLENARENSSANSITVKSSHGVDTIFCMESCGSPVSTTTTITPPSPVDDKFKDSEAEQLTELTPLREKLSSMTVRKEVNDVMFSLLPRETSCRKIVASSSLIKPSNLSSFHPYSLKPHNESVLTVDCSNSIDSCSFSRTQSAPSPILRLMGKDLVVSKEEPVQLPTSLPCSPDYSRANFVSYGIPNHFCFATYNNNYNNQMHTTPNPQVALQPQCYIERRDGQQRLRPVLPSYHTREVIVIDDDSHESEPEPRTNFAALPQSFQNADLMAPQTPFTCFPVQNPYASRMASTSQRQNQEGSFMFPSPSSLYFSQTLR